jgi:glycerol dehydrogenase
VFRKAVFPGKYIQGAGTIGELPALLELLGTRGLVLGSPTVVGKVLPECGVDLRARGVAVETFGGECCEEELARVGAAIEQEEVDVLVGMGGGKTIDTAKIAADRAGIPVVIVPTIASSDAPCSGCAVLYSAEGVFERVLYQRMNPSAVVVDLDILVRASPRFLVAGMGDALATWFEARSCERTASPSECGGGRTMVGLEIARLCYNTLLTYGEMARIAVERRVVTPAFDHIVEANILLSGIGFESAGLAAAHAVHNGLTALPQTHAYYHGEKVAFGVLTGLQLADAAPDEITAVYGFCECVGLPTTLADIGLGSVTPEELLAVAEKACAPDQSIHHEAGPITPPCVVDAMLAADGIGLARRGQG